MPVVTSVKCGRELARRRNVRIAVQHMTYFVGVLLSDARQRQFCEPFCCLFVEGRGRVRCCRRDRWHQQQDCDKTFHAWARAYSLLPGSASAWKIRTMHVRFRSLVKSTSAEAALGVIVAMTHIAAISV